MAVPKCAPKPPTEIVYFPLSLNELENALIYHLTYHYTVGIHINHIIFLQTYLYGWAVVFCSPPLAVPILLLVIMILLALYSILLVKGPGCLPFLFSLTLVSVCGYFTKQALADHAHVDDGYIALIGLGIVLASFIFQLLGHAMFEEFMAPPSLMHGFIAAPVLEGMSLLFRLGFYPDLARTVYAKVEAVRARAYLKNDILTTPSPTART